MTERVIEEASDEIPEIPEIAEQVILFAIDEARQTLVAGEELVPFTVLAVGENLFLETHPGDDADQCFAFAKHEVCGARGASAYAFCYDGFVDTDDGQMDCIIAEGGVPGEEDAYAVGVLYEETEEEFIFEEEAAYIGKAPNFMADLKDSSEYTEEEINQKYLEEAFGVDEEDF